MITDSKSTQADENWETNGSCWVYDQTASMIFEFYEIFISGFSCFVKLPV